MHIDRDSDGSGFMVPIVRGDFHKFALELEESAPGPAYALSGRARLGLGRRCGSNCRKGQPSWRCSNCRRGQPSWSKSWAVRGHWGRSRCRRCRGQHGRWRLSWRRHRIATGQTRRNSQSQETDDATYLQIPSHGLHYIRLFAAPRPCLMVPMPSIRPGPAKSGVGTRRTAEERHQPAQLFGILTKGWSSLGSPYSGQPRKRATACI